MLSFVSMHCTRVTDVQKGLVYLHLGQVGGIGHSVSIEIILRGRAPHPQIALFHPTIIHHANRVIYHVNTFFQIP